MHTRVNQNIAKGAGVMVKPQGESIILFLERLQVQFLVPMSDGSPGIPAPGDLILLLASVSPPLNAQTHILRHTYIYS